MFGRWRLLTLLATCSMFGCGSREPTMLEPQEARQHANLPRTSQTHSRALQAELARLEAEGATPVLLRPPDPIQGAPAISAAPAAVSVQLSKVFGTTFRKSLDDKIAGVWPDRGFSFMPTTRQAVTELTESNREQIEAFQRLVSRRGFSFEFDHSLGLLADTSYLDAVETGTRLLGLQASEDLAGGRLDTATERLAAMFKTAELLGREQFVALRVAAAHRRAEALQVLRGIAGHPQATRATYRTLNTLLSHQLERWPTDEATWIGDRALGLHTYELIRNGYLLSLLTEEEIRRYDERAGLKNLTSLVRENIDGDELFYLQAMRELIDASRQPFPTRTKVFRQLDRDLEILRDGKSYPFIADQLLLTKIEPIQRLLAVDRARCEAWRLALQLALDSEPAAGADLNPLTGLPFVVEVTAEQVVVDGIDNYGDEQAVLVPFRPSTAARPSRRR